MYGFVKTSPLTQKVNYSAKGKAKCSDGAPPETIQHSSLQCWCKLERLAVQMMIASSEQIMANKVCWQYYLLISKPKFFCQVQSEKQGQGKIVEVVTSINGIYDVQIPAKMNGEGPAIERSMQNSEYVNATISTYRGDPFRLCRPSWVCFSARVKGPVMTHSLHPATGRCQSRCIWCGLVNLSESDLQDCQKISDVCNLTREGSQASLTLHLRK